MSRSHRSRPRLLPLEDRTTPTCLVYAVQDTLYIIGDNAANTIGLVADGSSVRVGCDNAREVVFPNIQHIHTDLAGGNDNFSALRVRPVAPLGLWLVAGRGDDVANIEWAPGGSDSIWVDLGHGNDLLDARLIPLPLPNLPDIAVSLDVHGGDGSDEVGIVVIGSKVGLGGTAEFRVSGDAGDDRIALALTDLVLLEQGRVRIDAYGGAGADLINVDLNHATIPGHFDVNLAGFAGDDHLGVHWTDTPNFSVPLDPTSVAIVGGAGDDAIEYVADRFGGDVLCEGNDGDDTIGFDVTQSYSSVPVPLPNPIQDVVLRGGAGNDRITSRMGIQPTPFLPPLIEFDLVMDGGAGNDVLDAAFEANATQQKVQKVKVAMLGGAGDDILRLVWTPGIAFDVDAFVDGGVGFDVGIFSPGVRHVNVERLN